MSDHYTYRITWSAEDNEHVGLCAEFPSLSWLAPTPAAALSGIQRLVRECLADMHTTGEAVPEPIADRSYSGKFMVRLPPESHRALAIQAAEQGVSLNRLGECAACKCLLICGAFVPLDSQSSGTRSIPSVLVFPPLW